MYNSMAIPILGHVKLIIAKKKTLDIPFLAGQPRNGKGTAFLVKEEVFAKMKKNLDSDQMDERVYDNNDTHLWMAVMDRAVRDLVALEKYRKDPKVMDDPVFRYDYRTLKKWFQSASMEPGSFNWICSLVSIDPKWALKRLEERLEVSLSQDAARKSIILDTPSLETTPQYDEGLLQPDEGLLQHSPATAIATACAA
jgi:hypothetical protein